MTSARRPSLKRGLPPQVLWYALAGFCLACPIAYLLLDKAVFDWLAQRGGVQFSNLWIDAFRLLGKGWLLVWLPSVAVALTGRWRLALLTLLALLLLAVPVNALKLLVGRPRPRQEMVALQARPETEAAALRGMSFPSGDTAAAFAAAATVGTALAWPWAATALAAAGGIGLMRVVDSAHYPSDVLAGAALGLLAALGALRLVRLGSPPAIELWARPLAIAATLVIPAVVRFTHGPATLLLLLKTYVPLLLAVYLAARVRHAYLD